MMETCPLCGRYTLSREYPPRPCPICEEEMAAKSAVSLPISSPLPRQQQPTAEQHSNA
jgi:hypothetical protein